MELTLTLIIIIITSLVSIGGFTNRKIIDDLIFYPPAVSENNQWYRFITCGLIHADIFHLFLNMYGLYLFGTHVETAFMYIFGHKGGFMYIVLYITALIVCLLPTYKKHRGNFYYRSLGASGAVSAVIFSFILLFPLQKLGIIFLPVMMPGFIFGLIYLALSYWAERRSAGNINHSAHIWGGIYGIAFLVVTAQLLSNYEVLNNFITQVRQYLGI
jgi:membrane associated rhomboid family serine protease